MMKNKKQRSILWYDLSANRHNLNTREKVQTIVAKTAKVGFDTIVLDVKNYTGFAAYPSKLAPHISRSHYDGYEDPNYDLIAEVTDAAQNYGLDVHISLNTFSEGNDRFKNGPALQHKEWQTVYYQGVRILETEDGQSFDVHSVNQVPEKDKISVLFKWPESVNQLDHGVVRVENDHVSSVLEKGMSKEDVQSMVFNSSTYLILASGQAWKELKSHAEIGSSIDVSKTRPNFVPAEEIDHETHSVFVNPIREDVIQYELGIIHDILDNYRVQGIVLDRARYSNLFADFSPLSKKRFESDMGAMVERWPEDVFEIYYDESKRKVRWGPLFQEWIEWRAGNIQSYFKKAEEVTHSHDPNLYFSTYVGSWYPLYFSEGVNWGSTTYHPTFDWASPDYHKKGYAEVLDFLMTGNYFYEVTREEAVQAGNPDWHSVEGSADLAREAVNGVIPLYGSLFLRQYDGDPDQFVKAMKAVREKTDGLMIFDLVYLEQYDWWSLVSKENQLI